MEDQTQPYTPIPPAQMRDPSFRAPTDPLTFKVVGEPLTSSEVAALAKIPPKGEGQTLLQRMRINHHRAAKLMARGVDYRKISELVGVHRDTVKHWATDPLFSNLVTHYRAIGDKHEEITEDLIRTASQTALLEIIDRIETAPKSYTNEELRKLAKDALDRTGFGATTNQNVNNQYNIGAETLRSLREQQTLAEADVIDITPDDCEAVDTPNEETSDSTKSENSTLSDQCESTDRRAPGTNAGRPTSECEAPNPQPAQCGTVRPLPDPEEDGPPSAGAGIGPCGPSLSAFDCGPEAGRPVQTVPGDYPPSFTDNPVHGRVGTGLVRAGQPDPRGPDGDSDRSETDLHADRVQPDSEAI